MSDSRGNREWSFVIYCSGVDYTESPTGRPFGGALRSLRAPGPRSGWAPTGQGPRLDRPSQSSLWGGQWKPSRLPLGEIIATTSWDRGVGDHPDRRGKYRSAGGGLRAPRGGPPAAPRPTRGGEGRNRRPGAGYEAAPGRRRPGGSGCRTPGGSGRLLPMFCPDSRARGPAGGRNRTAALREIRISSR
jgi:hypothetical protein